MTDAFPQIDEEFQAKYEVLETVGAGGMGVIYRARHQILNRIVAVKMVHAHIVSPDVIQRFYHEGKASSSLSHPYIVKVLDFGTTQSGQPYMILDFVEGKTLAKVLTTAGTLSTEHFLSLFLQITEALSYAHNHGVLHRDIKPANIMVVENARGDEEIRLMDFGLARIVDDSEYAAQHLTKTGVAMGSPLYMSPEHARGSKMDERSDLYSLGCTMYEALTGTPPFVGKTPFETLLMHLNEPPLPLGEASLGKTIDPRLEQIVLKTLGKNLADRYQSMDELNAALLNIKNPPVDNLLETDKRKGNDRKGNDRNVKALYLVGAATGLCALTAAGFYYVHNKPQPTESLPNPIASIPKSATSPAKADPVATTPDAQVGAIKSATSGPGADENYAVANVSDFTSVTAKQVIAGLVKNHQPTIDATQYRELITSDADLEPLQEAEWSNKIILKDVPITDAGLSYLRNLKLTSLNLSATKVKDLAPLKEMKSLVDLSVPSTPLTSKGMHVIGGLPNLTTLNLTATKISDPDLAQLKGLTKLRVLELSGCQNLTSKAVNKLTVELRPCQVTFWQYAVADHKPFTEASEATRLLRNKDYTHSYAKFKAASTMLTNSTDQALKARCIAGAADCKAAVGSYADAAALYDQALAILDKQKPTDATTLEVLNNAARMQELMNHFAQASLLRSKLDETYKRCTGLEFSPQQIQNDRAVNLLCASYGTARASQPEKAARQFKLALSLLPEKERNTSKVARAAQQIGISYKQKKEDANAIHFLELAYKYYDSQGSKSQQPQVLLQQQLAEAYSSVGRFKDAENILRNIIDLPADPTLKDKRYACMIDVLKKQKKMSEASSLEAKRKSLQL